MCSTCTWTHVHVRLLPCTPRYKFCFFLHAWRILVAHVQVYPFFCSLCVQAWVPKQPKTHKATRSDTDIKNIWKKSCYGRGAARARRARSCSVYKPCTCQQVSYEKGRLLKSGCVRAPRRAVPRTRGRLLVSVCTPDESLANNTTRTHHVP